MDPSAAQGRWLKLGRRVRIPLGAARRELLAPAIAAARLSRQRFARPLAWFLTRSALLVIADLRVSGFTWPLLPTNCIAPVIILNAALLHREPVELARILLHEGAHLCGVVWPEWRNWVNTLARYALFFVRWRDPRWPVFAQARIYGVGVNSADNVAAAILADAMAQGWRP
jgi:hypothetical protein